MAQEEQRDLEKRTDLEIDLGVYNNFKPEKGFPANVSVPAPRVLLFDLGHVFLDAKYKIILRASRESGIEDETTRSIFSLEEHYAFGRGRIDSRSFCDAIRKTLDRPNISDMQIREVHDKHIIGLVPGMKSFLSLITEKHGKSNIVFVTDTCEWQTARQNELIDLSGYLIIASNEIGMLKSDPETIGSQGEPKDFFHHVLKELGLRPQQTLLVDDCPEKIAIAQRHGIQTIRFIDADQIIQELRTRNILD